MSVNSIARWEIGQDDAMRLIRDAAPRLKEAGAQKVRIVRAHTGQNTGQTLVIVSFETFEALGRAQPILQADQAYQSLIQEAHKVGKLLSRDILVEQEI